MESAFLTYNGASGLGIKNNDCGASPCTGRGDTNEGSNPEHAIDNDQRKDSILFSFAGDKVNLSATHFGWVSPASGYQDSDYSVYAYTGSGVGSLAGLNYNDAALATAGWALFGHYQGSSATGNKAITSNILLQLLVDRRRQWHQRRQKRCLQASLGRREHVYRQPWRNGVRWGQYVGARTGYPDMVGMGLLGLSRVRRRSAR